MIKDSAEKGKSAYAISKELGISKNTAKKYMEQPAQVHGLKGSHKSSKLDPYKPQLQAWMSHGIFNCKVLLERLQALGYDGYYEKMDRAAAGLEPDPRPDGDLFCRAHARLTPTEPDVKDKMNGSAALDTQPLRRYVVNKAAAGSTCCRNK